MKKALILIAAIALLSGCATGPSETDRLNNKIDSLKEAQRIDSLRFIRIQRWVDAGYSYPEAVKQSDACDSLTRLKYNF